jgi:hypothetical protein
MWRRTTSPSRDDRGGFVSRKRIILLAERPLR